MKIYSVTVTYSTTVEVEARSEDDACEMAEAEAWRVAQAGGLELVGSDVDSVMADDGEEDIAGEEGSDDE